jgi:hypothetical protein
MITTTNTVTITIAATRISIERKTARTSRAVLHGKTRDQPAR